MLCGLAVVSTGCKQQTVATAAGSYRTLTVSTTDRTVYSSYSASISGKQDVDIYPQVSGLITEICIEEGSDVKKGQKLFVIDQIPYIAALETAKANVESARANVATAKMTVDSKVELHRENVVSDFDLQQARNTLAQQEAALAQAEAELVNAQNNLSYTEVKSPVSGTAGMIPYKIGALVSSGISSPLVSVSDNEQMHVYFSMTETQILSLSRQNGTLKNALDALPEVTLQLSDGSDYEQSGRIDAISGIIDQNTGSARVRAVFPNPDKILRSGGSGIVRVPSQMKDCIAIPQEATYEIQDKIFVYKVVDGLTKSTEIKVFPIDDGKEYIVVSGLEVGDVIIADGAGLLREDTMVTTVSE